MKFCEKADIYLKVHKVIDSCTTKEHLKAAEKFKDLAFDSCLDRLLGAPASDAWREKVWEIN